VYSSEYLKVCLSRLRKKTGGRRDEKKKRNAGILRTPGTAAGERDGGAGGEWLKM